MNVVQALQSFIGPGFAARSGMTSLDLLTKSSIFELGIERVTKFILSRND